MFGIPSDCVHLKPKDALKIIYSDEVDRAFKKCNICYLLQALFSYNNCDHSFVELESYDFYYSDGEKIDICPPCMQNFYPEIIDTISGVVLFTMFYDYCHLYPCFPEQDKILWGAFLREEEMENSVESSHEEPLEETVAYFLGDIRKITYKGIPITSMLTGHNVMLEYMHMFNISFNEMISLFIKSIPFREKYLFDLGFGYGFLTPPVVIYKFIEKFSRYTISWRFGNHNRKRHICNYDFPKKLSSIWNYEMIYDICGLDSTGGHWLLESFHFKPSINNETKRILTNFLDNYKNINYRDVGTEDIKDLAWKYRFEESVDVKCLYAIYMFEQSIGLKEKLMNKFMEIGIHSDIINHKFRYYCCSLNEGDFF